MRNNEYTMICQLVLPVPSPYLVAYTSYYGFENSVNYHQIPKFQKASEQPHTGFSYVSRGPSNVIAVACLTIAERERFSMPRPPGHVRRCSENSVGFALLTNCDAGLACIPSSGPTMVSLSACTVCSRRQYILSTYHQQV